MDSTEPKTDELDEPVLGPLTTIEIGRWSRWIDENNRLFVVVDKWGPQTFDTRRETQLLVLEVERECSMLTPRSEFETAIRMGRIIRKID